MIFLRSQNAIAIAAALVLAGAPPAAAQVIVGRVVEDSSGAAVARARVTAVGQDGNGSRRTLTTDDGRFTLAVRGGRYRVQVARAGYNGARSEVVTVGPGDTARVTLRVSAAAYRLSTLTARGRPRRPPLAGVYVPVVATDEILSLPIRVHGDRGQMVIRGQMATPTGCYRLGGAAERLGNVINLAVQARIDRDAVCTPGVIGASTYKVTVRRLPAGTYTLRVIHAFRDNAWPAAVVMDTAVAVQ